MGLLGFFLSSRYPSLLISLLMRSASCSIRKDSRTLTTSSREVASWSRSKVKASRFASCFEPRSQRFPLRKGSVSFGDQSSILSNDRSCWIFTAASHSHARGI